MFLHNSIHDSFDRLPNNNWTQERETLARLPHLCNVGPTLLKIEGTANDTAGVEENSVYLARLW